MIVLFAEIHVESLLLCQVLISAFIRTGIRSQHVLFVAGTRHKCLEEPPIPVSHCVKSGYIYFYIEVQVKQACTQAKSTND